MSAAPAISGLRLRIQPARTRVAADALDLAFLTSDQRDLAARIWTELEERIGFGGLSCSWGWTESWLNAYGRDIDHSFAIGMDGGVPVAAALLTRGEDERRGPFRLRTVHLGASGEGMTDTVRVEYNRLLVAPHLRRRFARGIVQSLNGGRGNFDQLRFDGFPPEELAPFYKAGLPINVTRQVCRFADLMEMRAEGRTVLQSLRKHTAAKIRRTARRLEEAHGPITVEWASTLAEANTMLDELRELHRARWARAGKTGTFVSARYNQFHEEVIQRLFPAGQVLLARVRAGETVIGCDYGFIERNRVLSYQWGIAAFEDKRLSAGLLVGAAVMQAALDRGFDEYDWLAAGDALYKRELSTASRELDWAAASHGPRMRMIDALGEVDAWLQRRRHRFQPSIEGALEA